MSAKSDLNRFRKVAIWEGASWVILAALTTYKYTIGGLETLTRVFGYAHGFLFVLFLVFMLIVGTKYKWDIAMYVIAILASIIPFGTFIYDAKFLKPLSEK